MFFFFFDDYKECNKYLDENPDEAGELIKGIMKLQSVLAALLAILTGTNKTRISRAFNSKMKIEADEWRRMARAMGALIQLNKDPVSGKPKLEAIYPTEEVSEVLKELWYSDDINKSNILARYNLPLAILHFLGVEAKDFIIETVGPQKSRLLVDISTAIVYPIMFRSRQEGVDVELALFIPMRSTELYIGLFVTEDADLETYEAYKRIIGSDDEEDKAVLSEFRECGWTPAPYHERALAVTHIEFPAEQDDLYPELIRLFQAYDSLVKEITGVGLKRNISAPPEIKPDSLGDLMIIPVDAAERVMETRERVCEVDESHELFTGTDGKPYVEVAPVIPVLYQTRKKYGKAIESEANLVTLCPMCFSKLSHADDETKEDLLMTIYDRGKVRLSEAGVKATRLDVLVWNKAASAPTGTGLKSAGETFMERVDMYGKAINDMRGGEDE